MIYYSTFIVVSVVGLVIYCLNKYSEMNDLQSEKKPASSPVSLHHEEDCAEGGCGLVSVCNKSKKDENVVYFEDEELDSYKGRKADEYSEDEIAEFEYVLDTLLPKDVAPWLNSLCARELSLPASLRQKAISMSKNYTEQNERKA